MEYTCRVVFFELASFKDPIVVVCYLALWVIQRKRPKYIHTGLVVTNERGEQKLLHLTWDGIDAVPVTDNTSPLPNTRMTTEYTDLCYVESFDMVSMLSDAGYALSFRDLVFTLFRKPTRGWLCTDFVAVVLSMYHLERTDTKLSLLPDELYTELTKNAKR